MIEDFSKAIVLDPDHAVAYYVKRGFAKGKLQDYEGAIEDYSKAIEIDTEDANPYHQRRADVFFRLRQGEFIAFADRRDKRVQFRLQPIKKEFPKSVIDYSHNDIRINFESVHKQAHSLFYE